MQDHQSVAQHYTHGGLLDAIRAGVTALGKTSDKINVDDLAPVDEFHIGGRKASVEFFDQLHFSSTHHVLDVGCGLGGPARFAASRYGCRVTGIDLTPEYVETGKVLCQWTGLDDLVSLHQGSALSMPFLESAFDGAYMMHVGMNIADKARVFAEVRRVLKPGGRLVVGELFGDPHMVTHGALRRRAERAGLRVEHKLGGRLWHYTRLAHA